MKGLSLCAVLMVALWLSAPPLQAQPATPPLSAAALYNQGNAYARAGRPGMAVLHYERAQLLRPGDVDLAANLEAVRSAQHLFAQPPAWFSRLALFPTPLMAALAGLCGLGVLGFGTMLLPRLSSSRLFPFTAAFLGLALLGVPLAQAALLQPLLHAAVVIAPSAAVRVSPVPLGDTLFALTEAETVSVEGEHDDFLLIRTAAGRTGWVRGAEVARVLESGD